MGLSGGVDSAVSAALLVEQGHEVTGLFLEWAMKGGFERVATGHYAQIGFTKKGKLASVFSATDSLTAGAANYLHKNNQFIRPGFSLLDIQSDDEFVFCDRVPNQNQTVKPEERMGN